MRNFNDDDFKKEFMRFLKMYESEMNKFNNYFENTTNNNGFEDPLNELMRMLNADTGINTKNGSDEFGDWEKKSWSSPDGKTHYNSFTRNFNNGPSNYEFNPFFNEKEVDTIELLEKKLKQAVINEDYENAAKIRDLIDSLKK